MGVGVLVKGVSIISRPFEENQEDQVAENEDQENHLWQEFKENLGVFSLQHLVPCTQRYAKDHLNQAENQGDFHLVAVQKGDLIDGILPSRVDPKIIGISFILREISWVKHHGGFQTEWERGVFPENQNVNHP